MSTDLLCYACLSSNANEPAVTLYDGTAYCLEHAKGEESRRVDLIRKASGH
jgi:hypothetical protein